MRPRLAPATYVNGILAQDRVVLSRAITLIESRLLTDRQLADEVLQLILPHTGRSIRVGITGVPGVGKSTFIESLGQHITQQGTSLAVLTVDPSSQRSGGSILGDKTRMETLANNPRAYIRPSAAGTSLGGVAHRTREAMLLCEAAGFEVILVETVGVGQSETMVRGMTDFFLLLMLAGAGDELQGMKRGIIEMADALAITKADGHNHIYAARAVTEYQRALHLYPATESGWVPKVVTCSALENTGIGEIWDLIREFEQVSKGSHFFKKNRQNQTLDWMRSYIKQELETRFLTHPEVQLQLPLIESAVKNGEQLPIQAAKDLLYFFFK
ncbi:methylmalonyl Co-A mutase-associated GTPase MeaB [Arundinibacter roseus]|uniref:Methylmalonyl Co-A mutase-associated GTPase MeaB n=1 Tax=Arundinibacter roseus TaxID=2070510 RepID=A0A4R4KDD0_9BACT|nr:methylmalonyl Co-A mutase-associated GTPase MeaB [Arundinibacter roseus]TDB65838.1 methylmalonyl Co-A mutase-associated GTPase MeaB [Arundinibacter roseus]